jgi:hypothetical protein
VISFSLLSAMKVFYCIYRESAVFIRADDACHYGRIWVAMYKAGRWRDFISALPEEYQDRFEGQFENDSDLDQRIVPDQIMCSHDGTFPPGLPDGVVRQWMPNEIIEKFGEVGYDCNVSFYAKDAEQIIAILRREGYECVEALHLVSMMRFEMIDSSSSPARVSEIERLIEATEHELNVSSKRGENPL